MPNKRTSHLSKDFMPLEKPKKRFPNASWTRCSVSGSLQKLKKGQHGGARAPALYPDYCILFAFGNATSHLIHTEDALRLQNMSERPGRTQAFLRDGRYICRT